VELGPKIAIYAPWIVPPQFHAQPIDNAPPKDSNATAAATPPKEIQPKELPAKLQTLPGLDEPATLPTEAGSPVVRKYRSDMGLLEEPAKLPLETLTPSIDAPNLKDGGANDGQNREVPKSEAPSDRPPMPDLTDLLPDGPTPPPEGQAKSATP
jgi:hypothetical protein